MKRFQLLRVWDTGAHLGFSEGKGLNFRKRKNNTKTKKTNISYISHVHFLIITVEAIKVGTRTRTTVDNLFSRR